MPTASGACRVTPVAPPGSCAGTAPSHAGPPQRQAPGGSGRSSAKIVPPMSLRMQMHVDDVGQLDREPLPNADRGGAPAGTLDVLELEHDHVAAVTAAAVEVAAGGR